ncbi:RNA polymerase sigma factor [Oleiharenicola lentus]|uniref:RNA polymerase sigma factor n=1 Tax=Oleiharenicola lentus TaxID=2508720 RepID=UPI003F66DE78
MRDHARILHHVANGFATGTDRDDLLQELMVALWRAVPAFQGGSKASTFIYRVVHNAALTWRRTQHNYRKHIDRFEALTVRDARTAASVASREQETLETIYAHIRQLPPVDRSLILLHLDEVSYADMAELHGLSESNVGARLTRLKQKLTESMQEISHELR